MNESGYVNFAGALVADQTVNFADASYIRSVQRVMVSITQGGIPTTGDLTFGLNLGGVDTGLRFTYPQNLATQYQAFPLNTGLVVNSGVLLQPFVVSAGGASDVAFWIESTVSASGTDENWVTLTAALLQSRLSDPEYQSYTSTPIQGNQADPVPQILSRVTATVYQAVKSGGRCQMGQIGTIPNSLVSFAIDMAFFEFVTRIQFFQRYAEQAMKSRELALREITAVRKGQTIPEAPDNPLAIDGSRPLAWGSDRRLQIDTTETWIPNANSNCPNGHNANWSGRVWTPFTNN